MNKKFRIWHKERKEILQEEHRINLFYDGSFSVINCKTDENVGDEDDCILMQYTGLKDKNGKEIYEGDTVEIRRWKDTEDECYSISEVVFEKGCFRIPNNCISSIELGYNHPEIIKVIGNKYENPELLEENKSQGYSNKNGEVAQSVQSGT